MFYINENFALEVLKVPPTTNQRRRACAADGDDDGDGDGDAMRGIGLGRSSILGRPQRRDPTRAAEIASAASLCFPALPRTSLFFPALPCASPPNREGTRA